jgi:shikimate 5-dehydrogenase
LGAGGAARAAVYALAQAGADITILNRTIERARQLAQEMRTVWPERRLTAGRFPDELAQVAPKADLIVNCTSVGMSPNAEESPLPPEALDTEVIVAVDALGADEGQLVVVGIGSRVRDLTVGRDCPTKAVVVGIVDAARREL